MTDERRSSLKTFLLVLGAAAVVSAIARPAGARAPKLQYDQFDGSSSEIKDTKTGLTWDRFKVKKLTLDGADLYCGSTVFPSAGGRLPTVKELLTLVDEEPHAAYENLKYVDKAIDPSAFPEPQMPTDAPYMTSTTDGKGNVWTVEFTAGTTKLLPATTTLNVRCVH